MNFIFLLGFSITTDNASNNMTMVASLENLLSESGSTFTKKFHVPCMAHVLTLVVQGGLKELGDSSLSSLCLEREGDEECEEDDKKVTSQIPFGAILYRL